MASIQNDHTKAVCNCADCGSCAKTRNRADRARGIAAVGAATLADPDRAQALSNWPFEVMVGEVHVWRPSRRW